MGPQSVSDDRRLSQSKAPSLVPPSAAPSRRYSDKRRFTSRVAARERRSTESELLHDLGRSLPITQFALNSLDKISILRLAVANLKLRGLFGDHGAEPCGKAGASNRAIGCVTRAGLNVALDEVLFGGFLVVIDAATGDVFYVSEGISECLGLTSYEVTGKSIYEFSHPSDRLDIEQLLAPDASQPSQIHRSALIRLKCNLFPSINPLHFRPASNKVIHLSGKMFTQGPAASMFGVQSHRGLGPCFVGVGRVIPHPADNGYPFPTISSRVFTSLHSMKDLSFIRIDQSVEQLLRFNPTGLINLKGLDFVHGEDTNQVVPAVHCVFNKGQSQTGQYRFLCKGGGWVWVVSECSTLYTSTYRANTNCPASAVYCRNFVISDIESDQILSLLQLPDSKPQQPDAGTTASSPSQPPSYATTSEGSCSSAPSTPAGSGDDLMNASPTSLFEEFLHSGSETESDHAETPAWMPDPKLQATARAFSVKEEPFPYCDDDSLLRTLADDGMGVSLEELSTLPEFNEALDALLMKQEQSSPEEQAASLWSPSPQDPFLFADRSPKQEQLQQHELKRRAGEDEGN